MLMAGAMTMLIGMSALAVDTGSLFLQKRRLQGIADAAALASVANPTTQASAARAAINANNGQDVTVTALVPGTYTRDPTIAVTARFVAGSAGNAAQVTLTRQAPLFFGRILTGQPTSTIVATATAARIDMAAFSIGSRLAAVNGGLPNALLSGLVGADLGLTLLDYNNLIATDIDVLSFADALRTQLHLSSATLGDTLAAQATLPQVLQAMAAATTNTAAATALRTAAARAPGLVLKVADVIDLGSLGSKDAPDPTQPVQIDAYSLLRAVAETAGGAQQVKLNVGVPIPGLASTSVVLAMGQRAAHSPLLTVGKDNTAVVRTSQARLYIDAGLGTPIFGLGAVRLPVFVELAAAQASLSSISCPTGRSSATATLAVTPGIGEMAIADLDPTKLSDFSTAMTLNPAVVARAPLISIMAKADVKIGGTTAQSVGFSASDVAAGTVKTVTTNDAVQGIASSLVSRMSLTASVIGLGLNVSALTAAVGAVLTPAAPLLDSVVGDLTALLGIRLGQADVRVDALRCGTPVLVG